MSLISEDELQASHEKYHRDHPEVLRSRCPQCKRSRQAENNHAIKVVCDCAKEDAGYTVQELAKASGRRPAWVRKILRQAGLSAPEQPRAPWVPKGKRPCAVCGHLKCHHCRGTAPRRHVNPGLCTGWWICPRVPHCKDVIEVAPEQFVNCSCTHYSTRPLG